jgi:hypothetical protein
MGNRLIACVAVLSCAGWCLVAPVEAQGFQRARIDRPSRGPSYRLGWTGGRYTRQYGDVQGVRRPGAGGVDLSAIRGLPDISYFGAARGFANLPVAPLPQAFAFGRVGYQPRWSPAEMALWGQRVGTDDLSVASGFQRTTQFWVRLSGAGPFHLDVPDQPYYVPEREGTAFHMFFGLSPAKGESIPGEPPPFDSLAGALERENEQHIRRSLAQALETFRRATTRDAEDQAEALARARLGLAAVNRLDEEAYLPSLLLIHTALEQGQVQSAIGHLTRLVQRRPTVFAERPDLAAYFGDPEVLEGQMRSLLRIGDESPDQAGAYALQAYCAWVLNDQARLKYALDRMVKVNRQAGASAEISAIGYALASATQ